MSTVLEQRSLPEAERGRWRPWLVLLACLLLLYVPTYLALSRTLWREDEYAHGPIILVVFAWLMWRGRAALVDEAGERAPFLGGMLLVFGLALYVVGRSQGLPLFEVSSQLPVIAGVLLMVRGPAAVRRLAFPLLFLFFMIPLPGFLLEMATSPLKNFVSMVVESLLQGLGYPVVREGVVLTVGNHPMLVADACSGLNSIYSLFALGLLYLHLTGPSTRARIAAVLLGIVPIAVAANVLRVLALVLVTYHGGEEAAQGFVHDLAGMLVFVAALLLLLGYDRLLRRVLPAGGRKTERTIFAYEHDVGAREFETRHRSPWPVAIAALLMAGAAVAAPAMKPVASSERAIDLGKLIPSQFSGWSIDPDIVPIAPTPDVQAKLDRIYSQTVSRTYVNAAGERMMLTVAYGGDQSDALKAHRQEVCYTAQGFDIYGMRHGTLDAAGRSIPVTQMQAVRGDRSEPVTYWFTMGDRVVLGRLERLQVQLRSGLAGRVPDGMLVRISSIDGDPPRAFEAQQAFVAAILAAMPAADATRLVGAPQRQD
jgi:exosortase B